MSSLCNVGGVPAKVIRYRFPEDVIDALQKLEWWSLEDDVLKGNIGLFQNHHRCKIT